MLLSIRGEGEGDGAPELGTHVCGRALAISPLLPGASLAAEGQGKAPPPPHLCSSESELRFCHLPRSPNATAHGRMSNHQKRC